MKNNIVAIVFLIVVIAFLLWGFVSCMQSCVPQEKGYHECMKCKGTGRVRDKYGYYAYVTCDRCHGAGKLYY